MTANDFLCLICDKVEEVLTKEEYGGKYCKSQWDEIYRLYSYYSSLTTGCTISDDYNCTMEAAYGDFDPESSILTDSKTCAITISNISPTPEACPVITIAKL